MNLIFILSLIVNTPSYSLNYFRCEETSDCVKAYGGCGRYLSLHKRYKELYEAKAHKGDTKSFCSPLSEKNKQLKLLGVPTCKNQKCFLTIKESK